MLLFLLPPSCSLPPPLLPPRPDPRFPSLPARGCRSRGRRRRAHGAVGPGPDSGHAALRPRTAPRRPAAGGDLAAPGVGGAGGGGGRERPAGNGGRCRGACGGGVCLLPGLAVTLQPSRRRRAGPGAAGTCSAAGAALGPAGPRRGTKRARGAGRGPAGNARRRSALGRGWGGRVPPGPRAAPRRPTGRARILAARSWRGAAPPRPRAEGAPPPPGPAPRAAPSGAASREGERGRGGNGRDRPARSARPAAGDGVPPLRAARVPRARGRPAAQRPAGPAPRAASRLRARGRPGRELSGTLRCRGARGAPGEPYL